MKIPLHHKLSILEQIKQRDDFKNTLNDRPNMVVDDYNWWYHSYWCFKAFNQVIVFCEFSSNYEDDRQFLIYDPISDILRDANAFEDDIIRAYDDAEPVRELPDIDECWLLSRDHTNKVTTFYDGRELAQ